MKNFERLLSLCSLASCAALGVSAFYAHREIHSLHELASNFASRTIRINDPTTTFRDGEKDKWGNLIGLSYDRIDRLDERLTKIEGKVKLLEDDQRRKRDADVAGLPPSERQAFVASRTIREQENEQRIEAMEAAFRRIELERMDKERDEFRQTIENVGQSPAR